MIQISSFSQSLPLQVSINSALQAAADGYEEERVQELVRSTLLPIWRDNPALGRDALQQIRSPQTLYYIAKQIQGFEWYEKDVWKFNESQFLQMKEACSARSPNLNVSDISYGVIPIFEENGQHRVLAIQHKKNPKAGFPKGGQKGTESHLVTAQRELKEETNLDIVAWLQNDPIPEGNWNDQYKFGYRVKRQVILFPAMVTGDLKVDPKEGIAHHWVYLQNLSDIESDTFLQQAPETKRIIRLLPGLIKAYHNGSHTSGTKTV